MRRRLLLIYVALLAAVLAALAVPLGVAVATRDTQATFIAQLNDTVRFASLAEPALRTGETVTLGAELTRYDELFGVAAAVLDGNGRVVVASREGLDLDDEVARDRWTAAMAGQRSAVEGIVWPWDPAPLVLAEPVGRGGEVIGVAATVAPTGPLRSTVLRGWALLAAAGAAALALSWLAADRLARWTLRPVHDLEAAARQLTAGRMDARVPDRDGPVELRSLARSFNDMADTVTGALRQQRAFVSQASHQLRTPLAVLRLRVENLAGHLRAGGRREHALTLDETLRLGRILDGLLALARAEGGRHRLQEVDMDDAVERGLLTWAEPARACDVALRRTGALALPVLAVPGTLDQAVDALLDNALKFGAAGGVVTVHTDRDGGHGELHVIDHGPGLAERDRERATERFWRGSAQQNVAGSGLGLSIVTELVEAAEGSLRLSAVEPHGLDACLRLRLAPGERRTPPDREAPEGQEERASR